MAGLEALASVLLSAPPPAPWIVMPPVNTYWPVVPSEFAVIQTVLLLMLADEYTPGWITPPAQQLLAPVTVGVGTFPDSGSRSLGDEVGLGVHTLEGEQVAVDGGDVVE